MRPLLIILLLFFFLIGNLQAQSIVYKTYGIKDGLPGNNVFRVYRDKEGYMWISCDYGLSRFDGYTFKNYSYEQLNGTVLSIDESRDKLWVGVPHSYQYSITSDGFREYQPVTGLIKPTVIKMQIDKNDRRWLLNTQKFIQYIDGNSIHSLFIKNKSGKLVNVNDIYYASQCGLLIATDNGVFKVNSNNTLSTYKKSLPRQAAYCITADGLGNLYFGFDGHIYITGKDITRNISVRGKRRVIKIAVYNPSKIWFITPEPDLHLLEDERETIINEKLGLKNVFFNDIFCDRTGLLFLATNGEGLYTLSTTQTDYYNGQNGLSGNSVFALCETKQGIFIGSRGKINLYTDGKISEMNELPIKVDEKINAIINVDDQLWIATPFNIYKYSLNTHKYISFFPGAVCLNLDKDGNILAGGYDKAYMIDKNINGACTLSRFFPNIFDKRINYLLFDKDNGYWFAAGNGITLAKDSNVQVFADTITKGTRIVASDIKKDKNGTVWFATSRGIIKYSTDGKWRHYKTGDGLPDDIGLCLMPDKENMLVGTAKGLASYDGRNFTHYTPENGFPLNEILSILVKGDDVFLGTSQGLYICRNYRTKKDLPIPDVKFTSFKYGDSIIKPCDTMTIPYNNNPLIINFTAVEYIRQEYILYEYRIGKGSWYEIKTGSLPLTSLSPGTYTINVRAKHKTTSKVSRTESITVIVLPPFWQRWWFAGLCVLFTTLCSYLLISGRIKRIKQKEKIRIQRYTRLLQLKQQATNALMSPHFIFNALNSIQHFINQSDALSANRFLSKFAKMIRTTMENSARLNIKLKEEIELLELYLSLEAIRLNGKLSYEILVDETLDKEQVLLPSILIQPYVENAVWHGIGPKESPGTIIVEIKKISNSLISITIQDDGVGIDLGSNNNTGKHKSLALKLNEDRLKMIEKMTGQKVSLHVSSLTDNKGKKTGTFIRIMLPINLS